VHRPLVLFDLDGTLLRAGDRAHQRALLDGVRDVLGVEPVFAGVPLAGRLDGQIVHDLVAEHGLAAADVDAALPAIAARTTERYLEATARDGWTGAVLPGVVPLLDALEQPGPDGDRWVVGVLTGNLEGVARARLEHAGLAHRLHLGAFGDANVERWELVAVAMGACSDHHGGSHVVARTVLVGDTPRDVEAAARAGARSLAVPTGPIAPDTLAASGPDAMVDDLTDTARVVALLTDLVGRA
jgi:phosphoglycolate phosphatase-like HAD superfamily hydrolase